MIFPLNINYELIHRRKAMAYDYQFIVTKPADIETALGTLKTARDAVEAQKTTLNNLNSESLTTQGESPTALKGATAEKYQQAHTDLVQITATTASLMDIIMLCVRNYMTAQVQTDENAKSQMNTTP
jgi:GTP cyclohydrolase III